MDAIMDALKKHMMKMKSAGKEEPGETLADELKESMSDKAPELEGHGQDDSLVMKGLPQKEGTELPDQDQGEDQKLHEQIMKILMSGGDKMDKHGQALMAAKQSKMKM